MREILFRGKTIANNSLWVEGFYNHIPCGRFMCDEHCIQTIKEDGRIGQLFNVYAETVGQFTGLTDKNGKKIFEGDILKTEDRIVAVVWHKPSASWDSNFIRYVGEERWTGILNSQWGRWATVIGNIHDNPELWEVNND